MLDLECHNHFWDTPQHHGLVVWLVCLPFWVGCYETKSNSWPPRVDRPIGRNCIVSWNRSQTDDRGCLENDFAEAWPVRGSNTTNNATCQSRLDVVDGTLLSYTLEPCLWHKIANRVVEDISHSAILFEIDGLPNVPHGKGKPCNPLYSVEVEVSDFETQGFEKW